MEATGGSTAGTLDMGVAGTSNGGIAGTAMTGMSGSTAGGMTASSAGVGGTGASGSGNGSGMAPCDILAADGQICAAAHSTVRPMVGAYKGGLYQVKRGDGTTKDIGALNGYGDGAAQDKFCAGSTCIISIIYDQTGNGNDLTPAPAGSTKTTPDDPANAADLKVSLNGHASYGVRIKKGMGYRKVRATKTATGDEPETEYMVTSQNDLGPGCCFDYGNAEATGQGLGNGTMEALYIGGGVTHWGTGTPGGHKNGPWVMADLENGLYAGWENGQDQNISTNTAVKFDFVTAVLVGDVASKNNGKGRFALYGGDAKTTVLKTLYDGIRPEKPGYAPMDKRGGIVLGIGGDNSAGDYGLWYEGIMANGAATTATLSKLQANIAAAGYGK